MKRKDFFKRLSAIGVGTIILPGIVLNAKEAEKVIKTGDVIKHISISPMPGNIEIFPGNRYMLSNPIATSEDFNLIQKYPRVDLGNGNFVGGAKETAIILHDPKVSIIGIKYFEFPNHAIHFVASIEEGNRRLIGRGFMSWLSEDKLYIIVNEYHER